LTTSDSAFGRHEWLAVTADIAAARPVHGPAAVDLEHVAAATLFQPLRLRMGDCGARYIRR